MKFLPHLLRATLLLTTLGAAVCASAAIPVPEGARVAVAYKTPGQSDIQGVHTDAFMIPASTQKVLTATAASLFLGLDWQFKTRLLAEAGAMEQAKANGGVLNGNLVLEFNGAPDLTRQALINLLHYVRQQGVTQINGDLLLDVSNYAGYDRGNGWSWNDLPVCFTAPASAVIIDRNCVFAELKANQVGQIAEPMVKSGQPITITSEAQVVTLQDYYSGCELEVNLDSGNNYHLTGCIPAQKDKPWPLSFAVQDPTVWGISITSWAAQKAGLTISGKVQSVRHTPANLVELAHVPSAPLSKLLDRMLKRSDNLIADSLARALGHLYFKRPATYASGADAIREILRTRAGIDLGSALLADGSGLSAHNLIKASQMLQVLDFIAQNDGQLKLIDKLPVAGMSGTLGSRGSVQMPPLVKNVTAKTGTLQNVSNLAGFMTTASGQRKAFVVMVNGLTFPPKVRQALKAHRIASPHYKFERAVLEQIYREQPLQLID
ncbi:MAG: D-alanyl-D-alanine carboxypeptidase/D-alanyl-D-alanine-endopeptidase [Aeromonadaceae bacterium]